MAVLSELQILEYLKTPKNSRAIQLCLQHEQRLEMHVKPLVSQNQNSPALEEFLSGVRAILPADKFAKFKQLIPYPLPTVEISNTIFTSLGRVFEAQDAFVKCEFVSPELEADCQEYRDKIKDTNFWQTDGFDAFKKAIHSVVICDLPTTQETPLPEPYYYLLHASRLHDIQINKDNRCEYVIFTLPDDDKGNKFFAVFDDAAYMVYQQPKGKSDFIRFIEPVPHNLGYCPAKPFWNNFLDRNDNYIQKEGPITSLLSLLDDYLFWEVSFKYYQLYGAFPIMWQYESGDCQYTFQGSKCEAGYVNYTEVIYGVNDQQEIKHHQKRCPVCEVNTVGGAGSVARVPIPRNNTESDLREPVGFIQVPVDILKHQQQVQRSRKEEIKVAAIGRDIGGKGPTKTEEEVYGTFETKQDILSNIKRGFEEVHQWTLETVCRLKWGEMFKSCVVSYGTQFYLNSAEEYQEEYASSKKAGLPGYILSTVRHSVNAAKYRNNPDLLERSEILANLEPYPDLTIQELVDLKTKSPALVSDEDLLLKMNFDFFIKRFEREQLPVQQVASVNVSYSEKISLIQSKLYDYVRQQNTITKGNGVTGTAASAAVG